MSEKKNKIICIILVIAMAFSLLGVFRHHYAEAQITSESLMEYRKSPAVVEENQNALEENLEELKAEYAKVENSIVPAVDFFVTDLDESMYTTLYPLMSEYGFRGKMVLTHKQFPDGEGKITLEQFQELLDAGWTYCIGWDSDTDLADRIDTMQIRMERYELAMPDTIFDRDRLYTNDMAGILTDRGFKTVVVSELKEVISDEPKEESGVVLYHAATVDKLDVGPVLADESESGGGCLALRLRMKNDGETVFNEDKTRELFQQIKDLSDEERLYLCDRESMTAYWSSRVSERDEMLQSLKDAMEKIELQVSEEGQEQ